MHLHQLRKLLWPVFLLGLLIEWAVLEAVVSPHRPHRPPARGPFAYAVTDLGTLGGPTSEAFCINDHDQVVGVADLRPTVLPTVSHAFLWQSGRMTDLGVYNAEFALPPQAAGATTAGPQNSEAIGINDRGWVIGTSDGQEGPTYPFAFDGYRSHAVLWRCGMVRDLGTLPSYTDSTAFRMDDAGEVIGAADETIEGPSVHAYRAHTFFFNGHTTRPSSVLPWSVGMDAAGHIVGCVKRGRRIDVFLWRDGRPHRLASLPRSLRAVGFEFRSPSLIAWTLTYNIEHILDARAMYERGVVWRGGRMRTLPGLPGYTQSGVGGINASGVVVGEVQKAGSYPPQTRAALWRAGGAADLNTRISPDSGWVLQSATSINDAGDIVGYGLVAGQTRAFLLTPNVTPDHH